MTLLLSLHNIIVYLVGQGRIKTQGGALLTSFYGFSIPLLVFRSALIIDQLLLKNDIEVNTFLGELAVLCMINIGVTMILTSQKISIMLRDIQLEQSSDSLVRKILITGFIFGILCNIPIIIGLICINQDK